METPTIDFKPKDTAEYTGEVTDTQIAAWKEKNPKGIFFVKSGDHIGYFRNPYRGDVNAALAEMDNKKPLASIEKFCKMIWLGGSDAILNEDQIWLGVCAQVKDKMNGIKAELVNL